MALAANTNVQRRNDANPARHNAVVKTGAKIYAGALVALNAAGTALPCADSTTQTFFGLAVEECDTGDGTVTVEVITDIEILITAKTTVTAGLRGSTAIYAFDDAQVTNLATLGPQVGYMTQLESANNAWVFLRRSTMSKAS